MKTKLINKVATKIGPKMGKQMLKVKANAPDIAVFVGLGAVIFGTGWLVKRSYENGHKIDFYKQTIELANEEGNKETLKEARKDFAMHILKVYGPPIATVVAGCGGVFYGRHLFKTRNIALVTANGVLQNKLTTLMDRVNEEKGEGTAQEWANDVRKVKIDETDEKGKKKSKYIKTIGGSQNRFAITLDEASSKFHKSATLNRTMLLHAEEYLNRELALKGVVTLMDAYAEAGFSERMLTEIKGPKFVKMCKLMGWVKGGGTVINYQVFETDAPWADNNERFLKGVEPVCTIEPNVQGYIYDLV